MKTLLNTTLLMGALLFAAFAGTQAVQAGDGLDIESFVMDGLDEAEDAADDVAAEVRGDDYDDDYED